MITAFTLSGLVVIGLLALYLYRNRHKDKALGQPRISSNANDDGRLESASAQKTDLKIDLDDARLKSSSDTVTKKQIFTKPKVKRPMNSKNLLTMMSEKSGKPSTSGPLIHAPAVTEREKILRNEIDDNRSDQSNVPLALLYKNKHS